MSEEKTIPTERNIVISGDKGVNRIWSFRQDCGEPDNEYELWTSSWFCDDGDSCELYIEKNEIGGFELNCFSGIPGSKIYIDSVDFGTLWRKANIGTPIKTHSYEEQCVLIADYLCSLFCKYEDVSNYKTV